MYINRKFITICLVIIVAIAIVSRLYALGSVPEGLSWDETAIGYNGWSVWTAHRDEWMQLMPISFRSFGDYKSPIAVYMNGVSTVLFGLTPWAVRLPFAVCGVLSVIVFTMSLFLLQKKLMLASLSVIYGAFVFAIVPWHVHFSRTAFESGIALLFILFATLFFLLASVDRTIHHQRWKHISLFLGTLSAVLSFYTYNSAKIFVPVLLILIGVIYLRDIRKYWKTVSVYTILGLLMLLPLLFDIVFGAGNTRAGVLIPFSPSQPQLFIFAILQNIWVYLQPNFWLLGATHTLRHGDGVFGVLLPGMAIMIAIGLIIALKSRTKLMLVGLAWLFAGLLPGILSDYAPHATRTLFVLPALVFFATIGFNRLIELLNSHSWQSTASSLLISVVLILDILFFSAYLHHYYGSYNKESADAFQAGYEQLFQYLSVTKSTYPNDTQIVISNVYGQPHMYALFFEKIPAQLYNWGALSSYLFVDNVDAGTPSRHHALIVATAAEKLDKKPIQIIYSNSGILRFYVYQSDDLE